MNYPNFPQNPYRLSYVISDITINNLGTSIISIPIPSIEGESYDLNIIGENVRSNAPSGRVLVARINNISSGYSSVIHRINTTNVVSNNNATDGLLLGDVSQNSALPNESSHFIARITRANQNGNIKRMYSNGYSRITTDISNSFSSGVSNVSSPITLLQLLLNGSGEFNIGTRFVVFITPTIPS